MNHPVSTVLLLLGYAGCILLARAQTRSRGPGIFPPPQAPEAEDPYSEKRFGASMHFGASQDDLDLVEPIDPRLGMPESVPAIHRHIEMGDLNKIKSLIADSSVNINEKIDDGRTPLHRACFYGQLDIVNQLLKNPRIDALVTDDLGYNALHVASWRGHTDVIKALLKDGRIDPLAMTNPTVTRANPAFHVGRSEMVVLSDLEAKHAGSNAIMLAVSSGHNKAVRALIRSGRVDLDQTRAGQHVIHMAAYNGHASVVKTLLDVGVDVNIQTEDGATALWLAAHEGHLGVISVLLATKGIDMKKGTKEGSPLAMANWMQREEVVLMLLEAYGRKPKEGVAQKKRKNVLEKVFTKLDTSQDGTVSARELGRALPFFRDGKQTSDDALGAFDNDGKYGLSEDELGHYIGSFVHAKTSEAQAFGEATYDESVETLGPRLGTTFQSVTEELGDAFQKMKKQDL